ncbi:hypothetical protein [Pseudomonas serbica]|uniref:hypothetical protein n=1 Tax=Pseudomonas serbica TaxID=2965074 RepID=UPI00237B4CCB|nr:hypothetical protein [Pseudomonas serbica]
MTEDLRKLLKANVCTFLEKAVVRELSERLFTASPVGKIALEAKRWAQEWDIPESLIWAVIDRFQAFKFWHVEQGAVGGHLVSAGMVGSASAIGKRKKNVALRQIKDLSAADRANALKLSDLGPSSMSQITEVISLDNRKDALSHGYPGWLPTNLYWYEGLVFKPDEGLLAKLRSEFPDLCIDSCLAGMFDDLRESKQKPTLKTMPYAITRWIQENPTRAVVEQTAEDVARLAAMLEDED